MSKLIVVFTAVAFVLCIGLAAFAGNITGQMRNPLGEKQPNVTTSCCIYGSDSSSVSNFIMQTIAADPDPNKIGVFYSSFRTAGTYSQGMSEYTNYGVYYRKDLVVPQTGDSIYNIIQYNWYTPGTTSTPGILNNSYLFVCGQEWFVPWRTWYAQSFRANGDNICAVSIRVAGSSGGDVAVSIHEGDDPNGPQVGPTHLLAPDMSDAHMAQSAYWSAGEVPTIPGHIYTVKFALLTGGTFSPWHQTVRTRMRSELCEGRTWADGILIDGPLETTISTDNEGLINSMCCARASSYTPVSSSIEQTFTARGNSLLMVTWLCGNSDMCAVSVHDGPGGPQVGDITKYVYGYAWNGRTVVTWKPGEVPTVPGHVYSVKIRRNTGGSMTIYNAFGGDAYPGGTAYKDGDYAHPLSYDFAMGIYEEKESGYLDRTILTPTSFTVDTISPTSAVVRWNTPATADSTVDYGETPYTNTLYDSSAVTSHAVNLTGLRPNTMYHVRASSRASGCREGTTKDYVFVTAAKNPNLLSNPGFESGAMGAWTKYGSGDISVKGPWLGGSGPHTGNWGFVGGTNGGTVQGGCYQRVPVVPGLRYSLSGWLYTYCVGNFWTKGYQTTVKIGIDPTGGVNPNSASVVWTPLTNSDSTWTNVALSAVAASDYITAFAHGGNDSNIAWSIFAFDDFVLTRSTEPDETNASDALTNYADGSYLRISGARCTATAAQAGACYIENADRTNGIRVETADTMAQGEDVVVTGIIRTKTSGERYLQYASVDSRSMSTKLRPVFATSARHLGGGALGSYCAAIPGTLGPYNVGTLMRIAGKARPGSGCIYISDGSGLEIKVDTAGLTRIPGEGVTAAVTGIVQLEGTHGSATVLLKPRGDSDVDF